MKKLVIDPSRVKEIKIREKVELTKGELIVAKAKRELKDFIAHEIPLLNSALGFPTPDFTEEEDYVIPTGDLVESVFINIEVDNSYMGIEDRTYEDTEIAEIRLTLDGNVFVANEDGDEWPWDELSVEELANVATSLQRTYSAKVTA